MAPNLPDTDTKSHQVLCLAQVIAHLQQEGFVAAELLDTRNTDIVFDIEAQMDYSRCLATAAAGADIGVAREWQDMDLGHLLLGFLWRFGHAFDWGSDGVSVRLGGVVRKAGDWCQTDRPDGNRGLALEDPQVRVIQRGDSPP